MVSPVTTFLNSDVSVTNSFEMSSPMFASFPNIMTVLNRSPNFFRSSADIFFSDIRFDSVFKYVLFPLLPVPVRMNALPPARVFDLYMQAPTISSSNDLISWSPQDTLSSMLSITSLDACLLKSHGILFVITTSGVNSEKLSVKTL